MDHRILMDAVSWVGLKDYDKLYIKVRAVIAGTEFSFARRSRRKTNEQRG